MQRRDEIDATLAKHFAWTFVRPGDSAQVLERLRAVEEAIARSSDAADSGVVEAGTGMRRPSARNEPDAGEPSRDKAQAGCRALATSVAEAWDQPDEQARAQAVKRLISRADRLGVELVEMREWPLEAVRLLRLLVRLAPKLTRRQRERSATVAALLPIEHPETAELLVEVARAGDRVMADALLADEDWMPEVGEINALGARLADVVDDGPTHACRVIAIEFIARLEAAEAAVAALRRAVSLPSFAVRARALHALATAHPCAVELGDLVRVLRDLVAHAVPDALSDDENEESERIFADAVLIALEHVKPNATSPGAPARGQRAAGSSPPAQDQDPDDAAEALLDWIDAEHDTLWLDAGWATEALAIAFPEAGVAMVDYWLKCARAYDRTKALAALERLPDGLAEPRLRLAASDPAPSVRESARQNWLHRFGVACPADPAALTGGGLLDVPPTDRFASRLVVMQGRVAEARLAMARALLAEAPDRDALVLLLELVGDDTVSNEPLAPHLMKTATGDEASSKPDPSGAGGAHPPPSDRNRRAPHGGWAAAVAERFGALGVDGLCALARRFPEPESFGWMRRLGDLVESGCIAREHAAPLRALAARHVASEDVGVIDDALRLLVLVGAPPELLDRALGLALDVDLVSSAARDLILAWPDRAVDRRLASEMALAVAERDWGRVQCAASVALGRGSPAARVIAQRVLEIAEQDGDAVEAAVECAHRLRAAGALDDAWALWALGRPDSPIFTVAARVWRKSGTVRSMLEAALTSAARRGASRAEAAIALLWADPPLSPRDRRLGVVLASAPPLERAELVHAMCIQGAPLSHVASHLEELLVSSDDNVTRALVGIAHWLRSPKGQALLRVALPRVVDDELRADIEEELGTSTVSYWAEG